MKFTYIVPTYRQTDLNEICLKSLRQFHPESQVILVSDGDDTETQLKLSIICEKYNATLYCSFWNNYFAHSVNRGIDAAIDADIVILCNNDIVFTRNIEQKTKDIFESDPLIGVVGYLLYYPDGRIQHGGMKRLTHTHLFGHHDHGAYQHGADKSLKSRYSIGCTGALLAIKKSLTDKIGVLKTWGSSIANEDTEFCLRTWHCGYRIYYTADVSAIHAEGYTRGRTPTIKKQLGFDEPEKLSSYKFKEDIKAFDLDNIEKQIADLNDEEYIPIIQHVYKRKLGIARSKALGDCICITGIINKIAIENKDIEIFVATKEPWPFENNPNVKGIIDDKKYLKNHADEIIDLDLVQEKQPQKKFWKAYADYIFGENNYLDFKVKPALFTTQDDRLNMLVALKRNKAFIGSNYVVIHIGGNNWKEKLISIYTWADIVSYLRHNGYNVVIVGKVGDQCVEIYDVDTNIFNLIGKLTLSDIHQLIINAKMFIGIDSGILHIAQCTNTKIIGIFTITDPKNIIHREHWTKIIEPKSECKYCLTYKIKPPVTFMRCLTGTFECSKSITSDMIIEAIKSFDEPINNYVRIGDDNNLACGYKTSDNSGDKLYSLKNTDITINDKYSDPKYKKFRELMNQEIKPDPEYWHPMNTSEEREQAHEKIIDNIKNGNIKNGKITINDKPVKINPIPLDELIKNNSLIVSVHVTKTAGHTFNSVLKKIYGYKHIFYDYLPNRIGDPDKPSDIPLTIHPMYKVVHGHFKATLYDGIKITWVRNPVHQILSLFAHSIDKFNYDLKYTEADLLKFMRDYDKFYRNITCRYFDGLGIEDFAFIGIVEDYENSLKRFCDLFGHEYVEKQDRNINKNGVYFDFANNLSNKIISLIKAYNSYDIALYDKICNKFM